MTNDISALLLDSAILLVVGMSVVFGFLTVLIFAIHVIEWVANKLPTEEPFVAPLSGAQAAAPPASADVDPKVVAAITAAVHQHRRKS